MVKMIGPQHPAEQHSIQQQLEQKKLATQQMELQLRIIAVENACKAAKPGECLGDTLARIDALSGYLYTGKTNGAE